MSLPASQRRILERMEGGLLADEPRLASMFGIFARLADGEPVSSERLMSRRWMSRRWPGRRPPGPALYAVVLFPLIFALVALGAVLSGGAHSTGTCEVGYLAGRGVISQSASHTPGTC